MNPIPTYKIVLLTLPSPHYDPLNQMTLLAPLRIVCSAYYMKYMYIPICI